MPRIGIRKLKYSTSEVIRTVREERAEYIVTHRGRPVAVILPVDEAQEEETSVHARSINRDDAALQERLEALRAEIEAEWDTDKGAVELLSEGRR